MNDLTLCLDNKKVIRDLSAKIHIEVYENVIDDEIAFELLEMLTKHAKWKHSFMTKAGKISQRRNKSIYGNIQKYLATFRGKTIETLVNHWDEIPILKQLACSLSTVTQDSYNTCVLQYYANEHVGINPHRDKEVMGNKCITSLSLGSTRTMHFERNGMNYDIPLPNGSLCVIYSPTNDYWSHSIPCESEPKDKRISLVFRNH